jgi:C4-dicarboxylate-specific signal transduction histidine kinase
VSEAVDGQQAVDKAGQFLPDLLLVDMMMPEKDGVQVCRELRAKTSTQNIPIIMLTARADEETKLAALSAGASDFLTKPFSTTELHVRVRNLVSSYNYQRKLARQKQELEAAIEQLKETESQLIQSEKLASLGRLSAGLIHEINNPLNYAKTNLYALKEHGRHLAAERQTEYGEILKDIEDGINRVHTIVGDLRSFTHPRADQFGPVEVEKVVTLALRFLSHELADGIKVEVAIPPDQVVRGNQNLIVQILINLLQNSVDAMKEKTYSEGGPVLRVEGRREGRREVLSIRDNGMGVSPEILGKIFDPFFTTKDVGQGMGLGLAICHRIMQDHGGTISVKSEPGKFCEFALEFPGLSDTDA